MSILYRTHFLVGNNPGNMNQRTHLDLHGHLWNADACLMLLYNTVEENLRGINERMNDTHSGFLILDFSYI